MPFSEDSALAELDSGVQAIVPGQPDQSGLIERIYSDDEDLRMPPESTGLALSAHERQLFRRWIEQGAVYETHWSFVAPDRRGIPDLEDTWVRNPIDQFVLARLEYPIVTTAVIMLTLHAVVRAKAVSGSIKRQWLLYGLNHLKSFLSKALLTPMRINPFFHILIRHRALKVPRIDRHVMHIHSLGQID